MWSESSSLEQAPGDVVGEVAETESGAAQVLNAPVDRLCRPVAGAWPVEEREHVEGALPKGTAKLADIDERGRDAVAKRVDHRLHHLFRLLLLGLAVGGDNALVNAPGRFDLDMLLDREHGVEAGGVLVDEQTCTGVQGPARLLQRIPDAATMPENVLLDALPAPVEGVAGQTNDMERVHHRDRVGQLFRRGGL